MRGRGNGRNDSRLREERKDTYILRETKAKKES